MVCGFGSRASRTEPRPNERTLYVCIYVCVCVSIYEHRGIGSGRVLRAWVGGVFYSLIFLIFSFCALAIPVRRTRPGAYDRPHGKPNDSKMTRETGPAVKLARYIIRISFLALSRRRPFRPLVRCPQSRIMAFSFDKHEYGQLRNDRARLTYVAAARQSLSERTARGRK